MSAFSRQLSTGGARLMREKVITLSKMRIIQLGIDVNQDFTSENAMRSYPTFGTRSKSPNMQQDPITSRPMEHLQSQSFGKGTTSSMESMGGSYAMTQPRDDQLNSANVFSNDFAKQFLKQADPETQKFIYYMMNYYEHHLNKMKAIILEKTNENQQLKETAAAYKEKVNSLNLSMQNMSLGYEKGAMDLQTKLTAAQNEINYMRQVLEEYSARLNYQSSKQSKERSEEIENLTREMRQMREELEKQRVYVSQLNSAKMSLESNLMDLERKYHEETERNMKLIHRNDQMAQELENYHGAFVRFIESARSNC
eukprot:TRINITY_DN5759_c0_g1_i2.p1 TRINITY_DN5759_c0_g1~~TRINITY_DN5759_c0_g1_i2.p1  ORF type:complete len:311 (+),score=68.43 TRINITY_DN5759_c0_g1_i2:117-1049(+)